MPGPAEEKTGKAFAAWVARASDNAATAPDAIRPDRNFQRGGWLRRDRNDWRGRGGLGGGRRPGSTSANQGERRTHGRDSNKSNVNHASIVEFVCCVGNLSITAEDMYGMIKDDFDVEPRDLLAYTYPPLRDLKRIRYQSVCLGSYISWDVKNQVEIIQRELGWEGDQVEGMPWDDYPYEKIECYMQGMRDYIKYLKRGYSRVSQMVALDLRNGRITKEHGQELVDQFEGRKPPSLDHMAHQEGSIDAKTHWSLCHYRLARAVTSGMHL